VTRTGSEFWCSSRCRREPAWQSRSGGVVAAVRAPLRLARRAEPVSEPEPAVLVGSALRSTRPMPTPSTPYPWDVKHNTIQPARTAAVSARAERHDAVNHDRQRDRRCPFGLPDWVRSERDVCLLEHRHRRRSMPPTSPSPHPCGCWTTRELPGLSSGQPGGDPGVGDSESSDIPGLVSNLVYGRVSPYGGLLDDLLYDVSVPFTSLPADRLPWRTTSLRH